MIISHPREDAPVTTDEVIAAWSAYLAERMRDPAFDGANHAQRGHLYQVPPTVGQYQALSAYLDCQGFDWLTFATPEDRAKAHRETFGLSYPDADDAELERVLADHVRAMCKAYEQDLAAALGDLRL